VHPLEPLESCKFIIFIADGIAGGRKLLMAAVPLAGIVSFYGSYCPEELHW
jgi:hypothetical protein